MFFCTGIECLGDDSGTDDDAEQGACNECRAGSRSEKPKRSTLIPELARSERLDAGNILGNVPADQLNVGFWLQPNEKLTDKAFGKPTYERASARSLVNT